ncbi:hypothetical protein [Aurantibacillus circumpalustris]|uniref:hypothetical protein n=1 Tax=Aurantibacillus circumpalustris TaxID=3036359 RepID=UPI00295A8752|nr:hypothetical protein [Aurantibacillus circumpalustris]
MKLTHKITTLSFALAMVGVTFFSPGCKKSCTAPAITSSAASSVTNSSYDFTANVTEIDDQSLISMTLNGASVPFTYNTSSHELKATITLAAGANNIVITAKGCETKTGNFSITYDSPTMRLTGKNFKLTAFTVNPAIPPFGSDIYNQIPSCSQDNLSKFNANFTITNDEGATKCNSADPQTTSGGTWAWNTNETILTVTDPDPTVGSISITILTNDGTTLKGTVSEVINSVNYTYTYTFTKQ